MDKKKIIGTITTIINLLTFFLVLSSLIVFIVGVNSQKNIDPNIQVTLPYEFYLITILLILSVILTGAFSILIQAIHFYKERANQNFGGNNDVEENCMARNEKIFILIYLLLVGGNFMAGVMHSIFYSAYVRMLVDAPVGVLLVDAIRLNFTVGIVVAVFSVFNVVNGFVAISSSNYQRIV